jgi:imidazolonepropionase-like amidohydrolase
MSLIVSGATVMDGVSNSPIEGKSIWVEAGRIKAIGHPGEFGGHPRAEVIDASGKYVIPGLMNANVHLLGDVRLENLVRHENRYDQLIAEAAQVALKCGITTVFDTWGPLRPLMTVRDRINADEIPGSRIFCAGNIVGLDGPLSPDFFPKTLDVASPALAERINVVWSENVGAHLTGMTPDQVRQEMRAYIDKGIDFVKYASSDHRTGLVPVFLVFSERVQSVIVEEAHRAGMTAQAHINTVESLRMAVEAGSDLIQHGNFTGPTPIPESTLRMMVQRKTACVVFPFTRGRYDWAVERHDEIYSQWLASMNHNARSLIQFGVTLLLGTDGGLWAPDIATDPAWGKWLPGVDNLHDLEQGHIRWMKAMEELGFSPMESLKAATRNIAVTYGKGKELGTLEPGKIADLVILDKNPLQAPENYRSIHKIIKDGRVVDRGVLPLTPILTKPIEEPSAQLLAYRASRRALKLGYPSCC